MTSSLTSTSHCTTNTIGSPSDLSADKNADILGVVMTADQSQHDATWHDTTNTIGSISDLGNVDINILGVVMTTNKSQQRNKDDDDNSIKLIIKLIIMMSVTTLVYVATIYIAGVVMSFNPWAKSFIMTTLRICTYVSCDIKDIIILVANFLFQLIWTTAAKLPQDIKQATRCVRTKRMRIKSCMLPCEHRTSRKRLCVDTCFMMQTITQSYNTKRHPECAPYHGAKGQTWETFIRSFAAAMSTHVLDEDSLENTFYGLDVGGERWLDERYPGTCDYQTGVWQDVSGPCPEVAALEAKV